MTTKKHTLLFLLAFASMFGSVSSFAYPIIIKIVNPRAHSLYLVSENENIVVEIPSKESREIKIVSSENDWRVRYTTGIYQKAGQFVLDKDLNFFIETSCKNCMADGWKDKTIKYCTLQLEDVGAGVVGVYTLVVAKIEDLKIAYGDNAFLVTPIEEAARVVVMPKLFVLVSAAMFAQAKCLYRK